jgi:uncharacterized membrane protein YphA (DoxX/SURF4 family)
MFDSIGLRPGWLHARAAGTAEFAGGALIALGLFTPFAAAVLIAVMTAIRTSRSMRRTGSGTPTRAMSSTC